jgi:hypothetical protein
MSPPVSLQDNMLWAFRWRILASRRDYGKRATPIGLLELDTSKPYGRDF